MYFVGRGPNCTFFFFWNGFWFLGVSLTKLQHIFFLPPPHTLLSKTEKEKNTFEKGKNLDLVDSQIDNIARVSIRFQTPVFTAEPNEQSQRENAARTTQ